MTPTTRDQPSTQSTEQQTTDTGEYSKVNPADLPNSESTTSDGPPGTFLPLPLSPDLDRATAELTDEQLRLEAAREELRHVDAGL